LLRDPSFQSITRWSLLFQDEPRKATTVGEFCLDKSKCFLFCAEQHLVQSCASAFRTFSSKQPRDRLFLWGEGGRPTGILGRTVREMANKRDAFEEEIGQKKQFKKKANEIVIANFLDRLSVTSAHRVPQSSQA